jgi:hypothetical protein
MVWLRLTRLLAGIGLADQQVVDIDAQLARIERIERVLGVDEGASAAALLRFGDRVQGERGLARAFRTIDLDDAPPGQAANPHREVEPERSRGDDLDGFAAALGAHAHDRALAERPFDLGERGIERLVLFHPIYPCVSFNQPALELVT